jgi:DNA-binding transcriptional LysR family regulator
MEAKELNLHYVRVFAEVAAQGSVTRAAERLRISQPAVSVQVKRLEAEIGLALLRPEGRGVRLTEAGEILAGYARRLFALEREMEKRMEELRDGVAGCLRLGATNLPGHYLAPEWAARFQKRHGQVEVRVQTGNSQVIFTRLHEYEDDLALMAGGWEEPGIERELLWEDELWFVAPPGHHLCGRVVEVPELACEPFVLREPGSSTRQRLLSLFEMHGLPMPKGLELGGMLETTRAVAAGYGVTLAPSLAVQEAIESGRLARLHVAGVRFPMPIWLCRRSEEALSPTAEAFAKMVREIAREFQKNADEKM